MREFANGMTHCIGAVCATASLVLLGRISQPMHLLALSIFSLSMVALYSTSTLYHWLELSDKGVRLWRRIDHCMIFVFIAATYTPICLIVLHGTWQWALLFSVWSLALGGIILKIFWLNAPRWFSTGIYLGMGWFALLAIYPLMRALPLGALLWLLAGGLFYSIGAVIYALKRPRGCAAFGFHALFHVFVMLGTLCHAIVMYGYVAAM